MFHCMSSTTDNKGTTRALIASAALGFGVAAVALVRSNRVKPTPLSPYTIAEWKYANQHGWDFRAAWQGILRHISEAVRSFLSHA